MQHEEFSKNSITRHHNPIIIWFQAKKPSNDQVYSQTKLGHKYEALVVKVYQLKLQFNSTSKASKHCSRVCASPTISHFLQEKLPIHCVVSRFNLHNGMSNPIKHLYHCQQFIILTDNHEGLLFWVFPTNLQWSHGVTNWLDNWYVFLSISLRYS